MGKGQQRNGKLALASKKIRIYPEDSSKYFQALFLYRRAYNLAVHQYIKNTHLNKDGLFRNLRPEIKEVCKTERAEWDGAYNSLIVDNAVLAAKRTFLAICKTNKKLKGAKSGFATLNYKSKKGDIHSFAMDRFPSKLNPAKSALSKIFITEPIPEEAIGKSFIVTYNKGRWFLQVQQHIQTSTEIQGEVRAIAIDPGVRTFATAYSSSEVIIAGDRFSQNGLYPLMIKVDKLISRKTKLMNVDFGDKDEPQWYWDTLQFLNKNILKLKSKKDDLIRDLHHRLAFDLVSNYDVIFLPTFQTKQMVNKKGERRIRRVTARQMLDLNHYKFKQTIKWYADKYGKHIVDCNESYTSKTKSWNGEIMENLGSKKEIKEDGFVIDRDVNGARGILLKQLTFQAA